MPDRKFLWVVALVAVAGAAASAADPIKPDLKTFVWKAKSAGGAQLGGYDEGEGAFFLYTFGTATGKVDVPADGEYTVVVDASCDEANKMYGAFKLTIGDVVVVKEHFLTAQASKAYRFTATLKKGKQDLVVEFLNDEFKAGDYDRNLYLQAIRLEKK